MTAAQMVWMKKCTKKISLEDLYKRTGIQKQMFNTVYQLMAVKETHPEYMENAEALLMIPDYFHFLLTGVKKNEYTNATTGQLIDPKTNDWDYELMELLGFNTKMFQPVSMPGTVVGNFTEEIQKRSGLIVQSCFRLHTIQVRQCLRCRQMMTTRSISVPGHGH